ncbi:MAG: hypothetical protein E6G35_08830 [Actinobacteria bacterium]|nr:MAG: hypothetical protein E6G35_08830 [Actinomycetota bacterium]
MIHPARYAGAAVLVLVAGCAPTSPGPVPPPGPSWREVALPASAAGRPEVRDITSCPGHGYAAGGYRAPDGTTTPALWSTVDGRTWRAVTVQPRSAYGPRHLLSTVACRGDTVVAVGSAPGGVHGNLRTNTWIGTAPGPLTEVPSAFELFGGPEQIGVGPLVAGTDGWLLGGARTDANGDAGAAVWTSADGVRFGLVDADPALESDATGESVLTGVAAVPGGYVAVGSLVPARNPVARQPLVWRSTDGRRWTREVVPHTGEDADVEAVLPYRSGLLALGVQGNRFGTWLRAADRWRRGIRFAALAGTNLPQITGLVAIGGTAFTVGSHGTRFRLWRSPDAYTWTELSMPVPVPAGGLGTARLAALDGRLLLAAGGAGSLLWWAAAGG